MGPLNKKEKLNLQMLHQRRRGPKFRRAPAAAQRRLEQRRMRPLHVTLDRRQRPERDSTNLAPKSFRRRRIQNFGAVEIRHRMLKVHVSFCPTLAPDPIEKSFRIIRLAAERADFIFGFGFSFGLGRGFGIEIWPFLQHMFVPKL